MDRLIETTVALKYPKDKLEIQLLDDSTDETVEKSRNLINHYKSLGFDIHHLHRSGAEAYRTQGRGFRSGDES
ncbi:hypothetical protein LEP1GSC150_1644 [Leptospira interrogans serovar Copenhageni str. LT2050]|uniref:Uncharacterized protein n=1 Tax=Leptospira interrogans serovar Copenhageni str. LT2050 TaxID=1001598 RepID=M3IKJ2_LEPIT|nr:hypothetical protein LEP1GSC150_1644 [Leptospira interrogans serovar Copenhageni str. LT2050]